jgi:hypothetical protein
LWCCNWRCDVLELFRSIFAASKLLDAWTIMPESLSGRCL